MGHSGFTSASQKLLAEPGGKCKGGQMALSSQIPPPSQLGCETQMPPIVKGWSHTLPAAITAHSCCTASPRRSGGIFQHGEVAKESVCKPSVRQEVRHSGNEGRGCNGFLAQVHFFLTFSLSPIKHLQVAFPLIHPCDSSELSKPSSD